MRGGHQRSTALPQENTIPSKEDYLIEKIKQTLNVRVFVTDRSSWGNDVIDKNGFIKSIHTDRETFIKVGGEHVRWGDEFIIVDETFEEYVARKSK